MEVANASLLDEGTAAAEAMAMIARAVNSKVGVGARHGVFMSFPLKNHIKDTTCMVESLDWRFVFFFDLVESGGQEPILYQRQCASPVHRLHQDSSQVLWNGIGAFDAQGETRGDKHGQTDATNFVSCIENSWPLDVIGLLWFWFIGQFQPAENMIHDNDICLDFWFAFLWICLSIRHIICS